MRGSFHVSILLSALACGAADEEPGRKPRIGLRQPMLRLASRDAKATKAQACDSVCPSKSFEETMRREGLGESPGIPNLEYLGIGYNIFEGNPRGSGISEADPGFRSGVIELLQVQTELTVDQDYMVPLGVDLRYITACKFASKSTELSNEREYQEEISREASQETEISGGVTLPLVSISSSFAFSSSEKYKQFAETTTQTQSVTFEARALCSEFKAALKPYYTHSLHEEFETALESLSTPWVNTTEQIANYTAFLSAYGTHYVKDVTLGAKHIFSSEIKSEDVSTLKQSEVDIQSTLSWSVQASFNGGGGSGNDELQALPRFEANGSIPGVGEGTIYKYIFEEVSAGGGASSSEALSTNEKESSLERVKSTVTTINELNIGGNPPEDGNWKTWATTVRDRPMPISYELAGIWTVMNDDQVVAFERAIVELYNLDLREQKDSSIIDALRFGVTRGNGEAISSYSRSPSSNYRTSIQFKTIAGGETDIEYTGDINQSSDDAMDVEEECKAREPGVTTGRVLPPVVRDPPSDTFEYFVCGAKVEVMPKYDIGITGLYLRFCDIEDWDDTQVDKKVFSQTQWERVDASAEIVARDWVMCPKDQYVTGVKIKVDETAFQNEGINGLWIRCSPFIPGAQQVFSTERIVDFDNEGDTIWERDRRNPNTFLTGAGVRECQGLGIFGLALQFEPPKAGGSRFASYEYDVSREGDEISAIFAVPVRGSIGVNDEEDGNELGFAIDSKFNVVSYYPFGIFDRFKSKISIQDFKDTGTVPKDLQSFSFLSGKNLPDNGNYVAGVVHPDGYAVNENFIDDSIGFEISQTTAREYTITFDKIRSPTFLAFPLWFPGSSQSYPSSLGSVAIGTRFCGNNFCHVNTGALDSIAAKKNLGFSFVAIDGTSVTPSETTGILHGVVRMDANGMPISVPTRSGFTVTGDFKECTQGPNNNCKIDDFQFTGSTGGIKIEFNDPFRGLPAVIVNPIMGGGRDIEVGEGDDEVKVPYAVVEHITEKAAYVKVYWLDTFDQANPIQQAITFHIIVVGPQRNPYHANNRITDVPSQQRDTKPAK